MIKTKDFNPETDKKLLCTCGHSECDQRSVSLGHLRKVQVVRDSLNIVMAVRSGGRCPYHPDELHRATPADHQNGVGIDIACTGQTRGNVMIAAYKAGCNAFGIAKTFVHLGYRDYIPKEHTVMWTY